MIALVWRVDRDAFGGTQWPRFHIHQHIQKNANRVSRAACLELVRNASLLWMPGGVDGDRECCSGWWYRVMRRNSFSRTSRGNWGSTGSLEWAWSHASNTPATTPWKMTPFYIAKATIFCLCLIISSTLRATRAPSGSRAGPPSNLGVELKADTSTFEYEWHRVCLSVKTWNDEPSHVPLHARTLRGVALSSRWSSLSSLSAQAARRGFRGLMEALNWYWSCTAYFFCFQMCNRLPEIMKNGDAGIFLVYHSLKHISINVFTTPSHCP